MTTEEETMICIQCGKKITRNEGYYVWGDKFNPRYLHAKEECYGAYTGKIGGSRCL